jgi:hypothetical protein
MTSKHHRVIAGIAVSVCLFAAACGSDGDDAATEKATTTEAEKASTTTTEAEEKTTTTAAGAGEDVTEPVTTNFVAFFDNFAGDPALLEDGESLVADIDALRASAAEAGEIGVDVKGVTALEDADCESAGTIAPCAEVAYDLVVNGTAVVPDQTGYAVYQDDTWKVSLATFCALTAMGDGPPDAC